MYTHDRVASHYKEEPEPEERVNQAQEKTTTPNVVTTSINGHQVKIITLTKTEDPLVKL